MDRQKTLDAVLRLTSLPMAVSEKITDDFISFNPMKELRSLSAIEKAFNEAHKPGFDAFSFRQAIQNHYGLDKKTSSIVANSFRSRAGCMKTLTAGSSRCQWAFRGTCLSINRNMHEIFSGKFFLITEGIGAPYGRTMPGIEFGCNCDAKIVIEESSLIQKSNKTWFSRRMSIFLRK